MPVFGARACRLLAGGVSALAAVWVVGCGVVPVADAMPAVMVPALFVLAGLLSPLWDAAVFTSWILTAVGALHLGALAASALAQTSGTGAAWHALSQVLFVAGFAALLPLAAGYPRGPAPRATWLVAGAVCVLPVAAAFSAPTPAVLEPTGPGLLLGPIANVLPSWVASATSAVFLLPVAAVAVAAVRAVRGGRELRGRLGVALLALTAFAVLLALSSIVSGSARGAADALFLAGAPLVPAGLVLGARPITRPAELDSTRSTVALEAIEDLAPTALATLSPREREVLAAMAGGHTNAVIARQLLISTSAVEKHTTAIFTKLGLPPDPTTHRRVAAVVAYLRAVR